MGSEIALEIRIRGLFKNLLTMKLFEIIHDFHWMFLNENELVVLGTAQTAVSLFYSNIYKKIYLH